MRSQNVTNSDGVTFRLYADGRKLFDYHQTNDVWREFEFDFSARRGSNLTVRFEVDPGPEKQSFIRLLILGQPRTGAGGLCPARSSPPSAPAAGPLQPVGRGKEPEVAPQSGFPGTSAHQPVQRRGPFPLHGP